MKISLSLADFAQSDSTGKVNAIGLGWTTITTPLDPFALVIFLDVDWSETNKYHTIRCELRTADDQKQVMTEGEMGSQPVVFDAVVDAGRPPGAADHGVAVRFPLSVNIRTPLPLAPGRYEWRASVDGFEAAAVESFLVLRRPGQSNPTDGF